MIPITSLTMQHTTHERTGYRSSDRRINRLMIIKKLISFHSATRIAITQSDNHKEYCLNPTNWKCLGLLNPSSSPMWLPVVRKQSTRERPGIPSHPAGPEMVSRNRTYGAVSISYIGSSPMVPSSPYQSHRRYPIPQRVLFAQPNLHRDQTLCPSSEPGDGAFHSQPWSGLLYPAWRVVETSEINSRPILSKDWRILKAFFFSSSFPSSGFLFRRFLASTRSLAFF